jgi:hypothetical protein
MAKASKNTRGRKAANPSRGGGGCDTGRRTYPNKRTAEQASSTGTATRCGRCNGFHADDDHPRRRR